MQIYIYIYNVFSIQNATTGAAQDLPNDAQPDLTLLKVKGDVVRVFLELTSENMSERIWLLDGGLKRPDHRHDLFRQMMMAFA